MKRSAKRLGSGARIVCSFALAAMLVAMPCLAVDQSASPRDDVTIDGSKNPELVPQWSAWRFAFTQIRLAKDMPSDVISLVSRAESDSILQGAAADARFYGDCEKRVKAMQSSVLNEPDRAKQIDLLRTLQPKADDIEMECRQHTLDLRDRLLKALRPEGRAALIAWVEAGKAGHRVTMPKSRLEAYRKPE